jgi:hypothetical protein
MTSRNHRLRRWWRTAHGRLRGDAGVETTEYAVIAAAAVTGALIVVAIVTGFAQDVANSLQFGTPGPGGPQP